MQVTTKAWRNYIERMSSISKEAGSKIQDWVGRNGFSDDKALLDYAYALATHYGEAIGELSCQMYEATAVAQGAIVPAAEMAELPSYGEVAKVIHGSKKQSEAQVPRAMSRIVKQVGADTTLKNAQRDGAQFAWIPSGDTCAFCLTLASRGWQYMSKNTLKNGHAEHIHANCDCQYAIRFDKNSSVEGYDPEGLREKYDSFTGSPKDKIRQWQNEFREAHKDKINARKRLDYRNKVIKKMASNMKKNDWSETRPRLVTHEEKTGIIQYAKEKGVNIVDLSQFDGDEALLIEQIDTLAILEEKYEIGRHRITIMPKHLSDEDAFGELAGSGRTIYIETKALRNEKVTISNILSNGVFASKTPKDIVIHEYGHVLGKRYGNKGIELAQTAIYNITGKRKTEKEMMDYLGENISLYSISGKIHRNESITYEEVIPEILVKHENAPDRFTTEFIRLLMGE